MTQQRRSTPAAAVGTKMQGTIRNLQEAFGFITGDDGCDYFFHKSGLQQTTFAFHELRDGRRTSDPADRVEFTVTEHPKGPRAIEVRVLDGGDR